ncbi:MULTISPECIES: AAA family ATPase [unclassified Ruegeria]|uniref:AAA family ATPase n=1 Tax=unclassified Ruegeria TaxID=2625375 RepID=UPI00148928C0|nr:MULTISPECIES: AAA family ATPase [unclassified Ruegeria]
MKFTVFPPSRSEPSDFSGAALQQDEWNDYSFQTQYHLYLKTDEFSGLIGTVKLLRRGQTSTDPLQLQPGPLNPLDDAWVSLGQELDYYERLAQLSEPLRIEILEHLRDALSVSDHADSFVEEEGWRTSILRFIDWESFHRDATVLLERNYDRVARTGLTLEFQMAGWRDPLVLDFQAPRPVVHQQSSVLPDRLAVIIGRNGSGKSTLLSRLARILHASQRDRTGESLSKLGKVSPEGIGFTRVVNIAYSAFDAFQLPGIDYRERNQLVEDLEKGTGRYHYCGLRNLAKEVRRSEGVGDVDGMPIQEIGLDRQETVLFKTGEQLALEFERTVKRIEEMDRQEVFSEVCNVLATDPSFSDLGVNPAATVIGNPLSWFQVWSTGHKIVMHASASLVAYTEPKSIVLIDEPESHLHPPLLASFMHAVRLILEKNDAFGVVATHSPVVAQETLHRHTSVVRRNGGETTIRRPKIETYGESIGEISNEVFGLTSDTTDFHTVLSSLVERGLSLEQIEELFDLGLSLQARAFALSELAQRDL